MSFTASMTLKHTSFLISVFGLSQRSWYDLFHVHSVLRDVSLQRAHMLLKLLVSIRLNNSLCKGMIVVLCFGWCQCAHLAGVCFYDVPGNNFAKKGTHVHLKWHLSLDSFRLSFLHISSTLHTVLPWAVPSLSYPTTNSAKWEVLHTCTWWIDIHMLFDIIFHQVLSYDTLNLHLWLLDILYVLVWKYATDSGSSLCKISV